jgi:flagellar motor switch protein FliM
MTPDLSGQSSAARRPQDPLIDQSNFSAERLPGLVVVFDQFAENLAQVLAPLCRGEASVEVDTIETSGLFEKLAECRGLPVGLLHCPDLDARALAIFDRPFIDAFAHVAFGAANAPSARRAERPGRPVTRIETQLVERAARATAQALSAGFDGFIDAAFALERQEQVGDVQILGRRDMAVVTATLRFSAAGESGGMRLLLPQTTLLPIRLKLSKDPEAEAPAIDPRWAKQLKAGVSSALIPINGVLEEFEMTLGEIAELAVGRVLDLPGDAAGRVRLESGGQNLFWCKVIQGEGRYKLEIEETIEPEDGMLDAALAN